MIGLIIIGVPIAFSFGAATVSYVLLTSDLPLTVVVGRINEGMSHFLIGTARGGLSYVLLCAMYLENETNDASIHARDIAMRGKSNRTQERRRVKQSEPHGDCRVAPATRRTASMPFTPFP